MTPMAEPLHPTPPANDIPRRLPIGAEIVPGRGVHFRVWAPRRQRVDLVFDHEAAPPLCLAPESNGYFSGILPGAHPDLLYRFRLDGGRHHYPDPASRFQPHGPHGSSQVVDPSAFAWTDRDWAGIAAENQVLYEMHIGTFTPEGTFAAAQQELSELADLGITCLEVMPVCDFPGRFGWGYDGVNLFAPTRLYGHPDDFRRFVNEAHRLGIAVILDVVYNHLGPDGNYLKEFSDDYFSTRHSTEWGEPLNFDGPNCQPVREFCLSNARYWIEEFHLDGFRFDATQAIFDDSSTHILTEITRCARRAAGQRGIYLISENEPQDTRLVRPIDAGGHGMDGLWNDDFHHCALVSLTGRREAYYTDYRGTPQEFISAAKWGFLYQGQHYAWQKKRRGSPSLDLPPCSFITFIENHDQVANLARGLRTHQMTSPAQYRAMVALMLLSPQTPMLFQGQEFAASSPFLYFADHSRELSELVTKGRAEFLRQFACTATPEMADLLPDPADPATWRRCKLDFSERQRHAEIYCMYRDLLRLRREDKVLRGRWPGGLDGAVLGPEAMVLRFFGPDHDDRLLLVNFGSDLDLPIAPEPLLAPPLGKRWATVWSSEDPRYGGSGTPPPEVDGKWRILGRTTTLLWPVAPPIHVPQAAPTCAASTRMEIS